MIDMITHTFLNDNDYCWSDETSLLEEKGAFSSYGSEVCLLLTKYKTVSYGSATFFYKENEYPSPMTFTTFKNINKL